MNPQTLTTHLDLRGLSCPLPIVKTAKEIRTHASGDLIEVIATDPGAVPDFQAWCAATGHTLVEHDGHDGLFRFVIRKR